MHKISLEIQEAAGRLIKDNKDNMSLRQVTVTYNNKRVDYMHPAETGMEYSIWRFSFPFFPYAFPSGFSSALSFGFSW